MISDLLATYTRDLLLHDGSLIVIGRENMVKVNSDLNYILIDELVSVPAGSTNHFDDSAEVQNFVVQMKGDFTLDFYGVNARANAVSWFTKHKSQKSYELQRDLGFAVYHATSFRNLKSLEGSQYKERYQIEVSLYFNEVSAVDTLRIDTAQVSLIVNN